MSTPTPPRAFLLEELDARGWTPDDAARACRVDGRLIHRVITGHRITRTTATHLAQGFGTTPDYWLNLQAAWDQR